MEGKRMHLIAGTVPDKDFPLTFGEVLLEGDVLVIEGKKVLPLQGTGACIASAATVHRYLNTGETVKTVLVGDIGDGHGSRQLYSFLEKEVPNLSPRLVVLHYILPIMGKMKRVVASCRRVPKLFLVADAGSMYAAKAAGLAKEFEVFTPDPSEMAFLADEKATHPAYISHHLLSSNHAVEKLVEKAHHYNNASRVMMIKGKKDYIVSDGAIKETIEKPDIPVLEAIGGTGDTITGVLSTFVYIGMESWQACWAAGMTNRYAGMLLNPTPATKVSELIGMFPRVFEENLRQWPEICTRM
jgi:ADP-dependent NAD(P)H-hydrate dehydratase / NAD(P)H-hydrate epimerase